MDVVKRLLPLIAPPGRARGGKVATCAVFIHVLLNKRQNRASHEQTNKPQFGPKPGLLHHHRVKIAPPALPGGLPGSCCLHSKSCQFGIISIIGPLSGVLGFGDNDEVVHLLCRWGGAGRGGEGRGLFWVAAFSSSRVSISTPLYWYRVLCVVDR